MSKRAHSNYLYGLLAAGLVAFAVPADALAHDGCGSRFGQGFNNFNYAGYPGFGINTAAPAQIKKERKRRNRARRLMMSQQQQLLLNQQLQAQLAQWRTANPAAYASAYGNVYPNSLFNNPYALQNNPYGLYNANNPFGVYNNPGFLSYLQGSNPSIWSQLRSALGF